MERPGLHATQAQAAIPVHDLHGMGWLVAAYTAVDLDTFAPAGKSAAPLQADGRRQRADLAATSSDASPLMT
jgi:hypothetical protein